ncbi:MAG: DnaA regulatory inactivator Hda [Xanthomonadales bacterium]|nr:DnaA regulatory inactivator Hda [Xanthomonadales bacterium]
MADVEALGPQLPLALRFPPDQRFDAFVGMPAARAQLEAFAASPAGQALYVQGPPASGKTHLLLATCAAAEAQGHAVAYLSLARLRGRLAAATEGLEHADLVALDDVDTVAGDAADELSLFDLHNRLRDAGRGLLYAARETPEGVPPDLPDLRSRLAHCTRIALQPLDDVGRARLLRERAAARGLAFEDAALEWMLRRCSRDLRSLTALFERLDHASLVAQRRLTVPFLRQVLAAD